MLRARPWARVARAVSSRQTSCVEVLASALAGLAVVGPEALALCFGFGHVFAVLRLAVVAVAGAVVDLAVRVGPHLVGVAHRTILVGVPGGRVRFAGLAFVDAAVAAARALRVLHRLR